MSFKDMVATDIHAVFLNDMEFAERRTVVYDGKEYRNIPVVLTSFKEKDRSATVNDHAQGLYVVTAILHCAQSDLGGRLPEKGMRIKVSEGTYWRQFYIAGSGVEMGMLRLELEGIDE